MNTRSQEHRINIPTISQFREQEPYQPRRDLVDGRREDYVRICIPLYEASTKGDWKAAKDILDIQPELVRFSITENGDTSLHVAASAKSIKQLEKLVGNLVSLMEKEDLELQNIHSNTALCLAAAAGNVKMAEIMVNKNKNLLTIPGNQGMMPLYMAALFGKHDMVNYLYDNSQKMTGDCWTCQNRGWVLLKCVETDLFDVALKIVKDCPELADEENVFKSMLLSLAPKTHAFRGIKPHVIWRIIKSIFAVFLLKVGPVEKDSEAQQLLNVIWRNIARLPKQKIDYIMRGPPDQTKKDEKPKNSEFETQDLDLLEIISKNKKPTNLKDTKRTYSKDEKKNYSSRVLFVAAEMGNTKFVVEVIRQYPDIISKVNEYNQSIFHVAVSHRHEGIYNILNEMPSMKDSIIPLVDRDGNNMLHLVGKIAKKKRLQDVSGVVLQMQRELLWFKEVEKMIPPSYKENKNKEGLTPHELFSEEHKDLLTQGEKWMKGTAAQCMVVTTLIATIVFAAAFTIPGGYDQDKGNPIFLRKVTFMAFVISDAISLLSSSSSILLFLSILTSRYSERDFLESLPKKLMMGLALLFLSISTMMVAFSVSFFVLYHNKLIWVPVIIGLFAAIPVILFARLQYSLLKDVIRSTYGSRFLFKPKKRMLYY